jgi:hypothetical protein
VTRKEMSMSQSTIRRIAAVLTLASAVSLSAVASSQAAPRGGRSESGFTSLETHDFTWWGFLRNLLLKAGVRIDDNGFH